MADRLNGSRAGLAIVIPITSARHGLPSHIEIEPGASGLSQVGDAKTEDVKSISTQRLVRRFGTVGVDRLHLAEHALRLLLDPKQGPPSGHRWTRWCKRGRAGLAP